MVVVTARPVSQPAVEVNSVNQANLTRFSARGAPGT